MKKVAILTLPLNNYNYGGVLQAYALQTYIRSKFSTPVLHLDRQYDLSRTIRIKKEIHRLLHQKYYKYQEKYYSPLSRFIKENIHLSAPLYSIEALRRVLRIQEIGLVITGSDQVWRKEYAFNIADDLFLEFPFQGKKISYAASFGTDNFDLKGAVKRLGRLDGISLREGSAQRSLQKEGLIAHHHIDPTMLLESSHYSEIADRSNKTYKGTLVTYMLDRSASTESWVESIAAKRGLHRVSVGLKSKNQLKEFSSGTDPLDSIEDWLKAFRDAELIITDSFHGCVFSILFEKSFFTVGNEQRGLSRFTSLLDSFSRPDRLIYPGTDLEKLSANIDYKPVQTQLSTYRKEAEEYLGSYISHLS